MSAIAEFRPPPPIAPPGASPLLGAILLAIDMASTLDDLAGWWRAHQPALVVLSPAELAIAIARKDDRKTDLAAEAMEQSNFF